MDKPLTTPEQRRDLEANGWQRINPDIVAFKGELWWSESDSHVELRRSGKHQWCGKPTELLEFCTVIGWAPRGHVLVPIKEATPERLQARVAELESALRPFAALCYHGGIRADMPNNTPMCISLGDIRRARAVLAKVGDPND